tara:strand:- start:5 stop:1042 length:1038 start_codon:yes stop_codon:yes gene_type:complete
MNEFQISGRMIGQNHKPLVIAEIGINHNGSLEEAKKMVDAACDAGIEMIKHQTHIIEDEMSHHAQSVIPGNSDKSIYQIMSESALSEKEEIELMEYVLKKNKIFISTPFSRAAADRLESMNVPAFKIGSGECNNYPLIKHIAEFGKPIILSTGMNNIDTIMPAVEILRNHQVDFALLHTTNLYPTPNHLVRLDAIKQLQENFPDAIVGLSDHTLSNHACFGAVALGASILERHFTDSMKREGPDIVCSMDAKTATELLEGVEILFQERGGVKEATLEEKPTINFAFASVVSIANIKKGDLFNKDNIWVKRPGTGEILADEYEDLIGKKANQDISSDQQISREHFD